MTAFAYVIHSLERAITVTMMKIDVVSSICVGCVSLLCTVNVTFQYSILVLLHVFIK